MDHDPIQTLLLPQERILWQGRPVQGLIANIQDARPVPSILFGLGVSVIFLHGDMSIHRAISFIALAKGALFIAVFVIVARFAVDAWLRRWMVYAVTDMRILICRTGSFADVLALDLGLARHVEIFDERGTYGSIRFGPRDQYRDITLFNCVRLLDPKPHFLKIEGAGKVFNVILMAAKQGRVRQN